MKTKKIKILFPEVEAGLGHIMTCRAVREIFEKKYNKYFDIVTGDFYKNNKYRSLRAYGKTLSSQVEIYTKHPFIGHLITLNSDFWGTKLSLGFAVRFPHIWAVRDGVKYIEEQKADVIFSTHWATNYYAEHIKENKPFTILYCPDCYLNRPFKSKADLTLCSMMTGYEEALNDKKYDSSRLKLVPFCIRNEAFKVVKTKEQCRKDLGIDSRFTVVFTEGGYGNGKMYKIIKKLLQLNVAMNIVAINGKNEKQNKKIQELGSTSNTNIISLGFVNNIFEYIKAADLFCGKAGNMIAEPTFFGVPSLISGLSTGIENHIAEYYVNYIQSAMLEKNPNNAAKMIENFAKNPKILEKYKENALKHHEYFNAETTADFIFNEIMKHFNLEVK